MASLLLYTAFHSLVYWGTLQFAHTTRNDYVVAMEPMTEPRKIYWVRERIASFLMNTYTMLHLGGMLRYMNPTMALELFVKNPTPSQWIVSQYALELAVSGMTLMRRLWNPLEPISVASVGTITLNMVLLGLTYERHYTNLGGWILILMNSTNLFYDYFKYGALVDDIYIKLISSAFYWIMSLSRIHMLASSIFMPCLLHFYKRAFTSLTMEDWMICVGIHMFVGLQSSAFYKGTLFQWRATKHFLLHPSVILHVPDTILQWIDPSALLIKEIIHRQEYDTVESHRLNESDFEADDEDDEEDAKDADVEEDADDVEDADDEEEDADDDEEAKADDTEAELEIKEDTETESSEEPDIKETEEAKEDTKPFTAEDLANSITDLSELKENIGEDIRELLSQWRTMLTSQLEDIQEEKEKEWITYKAL